MPQPLIGCAVAKFGAISKGLRMRPCFKFSMSADAPEASLAIMDEIGFWGVQAADFRSALAAVTQKVLNVEISSPGGDAMVGLAIYNMLRASGKEIKVKVMGVAASAASLIMLAGDVRSMPSNAFVMVHNPMTGLYGNAEELRAASDTLQKIEDSITATFVARTGMDSAKMETLLSKDTWLTAAEALEMGFATEVTEEIKATASFDMERADLPENVKAVFAQSQKTPAEIAAEAAETERVAAETARLEALKTAPDHAVAQQVNDAVVEAGLAAHAPAFILGCASLADAQVRIAAAKEINTICALLKKPEAAAPFIKANTSVADARAALVLAAAEADENVNATPPPRSKTPSGASSGVTTASMWDSHRKATIRKKD